MKQSQRKLITFFLILLMATMMFCVVGSAAEEAAEPDSGISVASVIDRVKTELSEAPYIGSYCKQAFDGIANISSYYFIIFGVLALIECFFGYRLLKLELLLIGLIGGFIGGLILYPYVLRLIPSLPAMTELIIGAVCGIIGALLVHFLFKVAIFAGVGYLVYLYSAPYLTNVQNGLLYRILIAAGCAIIAVFLIKLVFVLVTSILGGAIALTQFLSKVAAVQGILYANDSIFRFTERLGITGVTWALIAGGVIGILGLFFQVANTRKRRA